MNSKPPSPRKRVISESTVGPRIIYAPSTFTLFGFFFFSLLLFSVSRQEGQQYDDRKNRVGPRASWIVASCAPPGAGILAGKILDHHRREGQFSLFEEEFILPSLIGDRIFVRRMDCREKKGEKLCIDIYIYVRVHHRTISTRISATIERIGYSKVFLFSFKKIIL